MVKHLINYSLIIFILAITTLKVGASVLEPYENFIKGNIRVNDSLTVKDEKFNNPYVKWSGITNLSVRNSISLRILTDQLISKSFSCEVSLRVAYFSDPSQTVPTEIDSVKLHVNYSGTKGAVYKLIDVYKFSGAHLVKVYVTGISSPEYGAELPPVLQLTSRIMINRQYPFDPGVKINQHETVNAPATASPEVPKKKGGISFAKFMGPSSAPSVDSSLLYLQWDNIGGAEYDIEWAAIDNSALIYQSLLDSALTPITGMEPRLGTLFRNNAGRVTVHGNSYPLSLIYNFIYNTGFIAVRIRQIQYDPVSGIRLEGDWDYKLGDDGAYAIWRLKWHEHNLNWQYSASFAEEGKKKEVISYFDGSLRGRQTATVNSSDTIAVIQENVYDEFGRSAASILPAPYRDTTLTDQRLRYYPDFNRSRAGTSYTADSILSTTCWVKPAPLDTLYGAARYYSSQNQFINKSWFTNIAYVPNAFGFPISATQYTADNTGRIKQQGGVGPIFQPDTSVNSRTTRYYYGKPTQDELDELFGNDVGYSEHYLKNMVMDPNGQLSVSYLNASGKTIATALTGSEPAMLQALPSKPAPTLRQTRLLKPEQFVFDASTLHIRASTTYLASVMDSVTLKYDIEKLISHYPGGGFTPPSNAYYELSIKVTDDCKTVVYTSPAPVKIGSKTPNNLAGGVHQDSIRMKFKKAGEYYITFDFAMKDSVIRAYTDRYIDTAQTAGVVRKQMSFVKYYLNQLDMSACFADCQTSLQQLGTQSAFTAMAKSTLFNAGIDSTAVYASATGIYIDSLYTDLHAKCVAFMATCQPSPCAQVRGLMLTDVSPGGQYALFDSLGVAQDTVVHVLFQKFKDGVFNDLSSADPIYQANLVTLDDGRITSPYDHDFNLNDLVKYWQPAWAEKFLPYHPESCKLAFCDSTAKYQNWDTRLSDNFYATDSIAGIPHAPGEPPSYSYRNTNQLLNADRFFQDTGSLGYAYRTQMLADLDSFSVRVLHTPPGFAVKNLTKFVDYTLYCADTTFNTNVDAGDPNTWLNCTPKDSCRVPQREWDLYVGHYLDLKAKYYSMARSVFCADSITCPIGKPITGIADTSVITPPTGCSIGGSSFHLTLSVDGSQTSSTPVVYHDLEAGVRDVTFTVEAGSAGVQPSTTCPPGFSTEKNFYNCLDVTVSGSPSTTQHYFNSWLITCREECPVINNRMYQTYVGDGYRDVDGSAEYSFTFVDPGSPIDCPDGSWTFMDTATVTCTQITTGDNTYSEFIYNKIRIRCTRPTMAPRYGFAAGLPPADPSEENLNLVLKQTVPDAKQRAKELLAIKKLKTLKGKLVADSLYNAIYLITKDPTEVQAHRNAIKSGKKMSGFGEFRFISNLQVTAGPHKLQYYRNVWVAQYQAAGGPNTPPFEAIERNRKKLATKLTEKSVPKSGMSLMSPTDFPCAETDYFFHNVGDTVVSGQFGQRFDITVKPEIGTCASDRYVKLWVYDDYWFEYTTLTMPAHQRKIVGFIPSSAHPTTGLLDVIPCGDACDNYEVDPPPTTDSTRCAVLATKKSRFPEVDRMASGSFTLADYQGQGEVQLDSLLKLTCEGHALLAVARLDSGLIAKYTTAGVLDSVTYFAKRNSLIEKMKELCMAAGDSSHRMGASSMPPGGTSPSGYFDFGAIIKGVLPISTFTPKLNPWLIDGPPPYTTKQITIAQTISSANATICSRLNSMRPGGFNDNDFYTWLGSTYGNAMTLSRPDFDQLLKGCNNCRYLLATDIKLPVFLGDGMGCITRSNYQLAMDTLAMNIPGLDTLAENYELIVTNYLNLKFGFALGYSAYKTFGNSPLVPLLCNEPPYIEVPEDPYTCVRSLIATAAVNGDRDYQEYIKEEKRKFREAYIAMSANAKANAYLVAKEQTYHYTLYYYDQADNLVRTIPPAGVKLLNAQQINWVQEARSSTANCSTYGLNGEPLAVADTATALSSLATRVGSTSANAIEQWIYKGDITKQVIASTTGSTGYMLNTCINNGKVGVDIYSFTKTSTSVTFTHSNHVTADISSLGALHPWSHVVVQGTDLATGSLDIFVNGIQFTPISGAPSAGCSWEVTSDPLHLPFNLDALKHLRLYSRLMDTAEIRINANNNCFLPNNTAGMQWYRFGVPEAGSETTIAWNSTVETRHSAVYPQHNLPTTYTYNSTNQVVSQQSPDGGTSRFWYDMLSRLVISRNAKQKLNSDYSYTKYDLLGRITEVGQKYNTTALDSSFAYLSASAITSFHAAGSNSQLTQTIYDKAPSAGSGIPSGIIQGNLRKRVAASIYRETPSDNNINATYYNYDLNGNVKTLYQQVAGLYNPSVAGSLKKIDYEYDLVSGKVNFVAYQHGRKDQFYYKYDYDAENRITKAWSATEAIVNTFGGSELDDDYKRTDASYYYYLHGPLARTELGDELIGKVQGMDYAYTLQGWLKGVNGDRLTSTGDIGRDSVNVAKDAIAYSLKYYDNDFKAIRNTANAFSFSYVYVAGILGSPLFNGNISSGTVAIKHINGGNVLGSRYAYDQLNRLRVSATANLSYNGTSWSDTGQLPYLINPTYDANGNIKNLVRVGSGMVMDNLTYAYKPNTNQLISVSDPIDKNRYTTDIDSTNTYEYDAIGNLIGEKGPNDFNNAIDWTVYGKIRSINHVVTHSGICDPWLDPWCDINPDAPGFSVTYSYDAAGNRVAKETQNGLKTWYVRDAQGNTLAVYDNNTIGGTYWREQNLYGSSRLGTWTPNLNVATTTGSTVWDTIGKKNYELTNHLGNVLSVITDKPVLSSGVYEPEVVSAQDYYAFGMIMEGRTYAMDTTKAYRYGFNGKENDNEVKGGGNQQDYGMRIYDGRLGRFLSVDPITAEYPELTPYQFASNSPIAGIDLDGLEYLDANKARIQINGATVSIRLQNFNQITQNLWKQRDAAGHWPAGNIGYPTEVGTFEVPGLPKSADALNLDNTYGANDPTYNAHNFKVENPRAKSTGLPDRRYKDQSISGVGAGTKGTAVAALALNAINWGLQEFINYQTAEDRDLVYEHTSILRNQVLNDLNTALNSGMIPKKYMNAQNLGDISNVILTGVNLTKDKEIGKIGMRIVKEISKNYKQPMTTFSLPVQNGADNTAVRRTYIVPVPEKKD